MLLLMPGASGTPDTAGGPPDTGVGNTQATRDSLGPPRRRVS